MLCGAKRIRSLYLPQMTGATSKLSTKTPAKDLASLSTINAATMRLCRADLAAPRHPIAAESRSHREKGGRIRGRTRWLVHGAGYHAGSK